MYELKKDEVTAGAYSEIQNMIKLLTINETFFEQKLKNHKKAKNNKQLQCVKNSYKRILKYIF